MVQNSGYVERHAAMNVEPYLQDLEAQINPEIEEDLLWQWRRFCLGQCPDEVFIPRRKAASPRKLEWPKFSVNAAFDDFDKMLLQQLDTCSWTLHTAGGSMLGVRSNYGVPILAMPFGPELFMMEESANTLPNCHPLGTEKVHELAEHGMPSLDHPYLQRVWEMGRRYMEVKRRYPKIAKYIFVYHPDFQGPMDVLELIWGSEIFLAFGDEPEFVHRMLKLITDFYIAAMQRWQSIVPNFDAQVSCHWNVMQPGQIMIRDDSAMNLPPDYFTEFVRPYDQRLLDSFGGGCIHACGRVDHYSPQFAGMPGLKAFNMSQPHLNDMEKVYRDTVDQGILLVWFDATAVKEAQARGRRFCGRVQTYA